MPPKPRKHFPRKGKKPRFVSGARIGARAQKVYMCEACDWIDQPGAPKPAQCEFCGCMAFIMFDSTGECGRWHQLRMLENAKDPAQRVTNLRRQVRFDLNAFDESFVRPRARKVGEYWADFVYEQNGATIIEDYKGGEVMTELASWKLRHMAAQGNPVKISK